MTLFLVDLASYQEGINLDVVKNAGFGLVNIKLTQGNWYAWSRGAFYADQARARDMGICTFSWIDNSANGAVQAQYAYRQMVAIGGPVGMAHQCDCEDPSRPASYQIWRDYVHWWQDKLGRPIANYTGDWWWQARGWDGASVTPYLWAPPNAGYLASYPGDTSAQWHAGYGGWKDYALLQYAVQPIANAGGGNLSKTAIRDSAVWNTLTGGSDMQMSDPIPNFPGKTVGTTLSDLAHTLLDGYSGYVPASRMFLPAYFDVLSGKLDTLITALASGTGQDMTNLQRILDALNAMPARLSQFSDEQAEALATKLSTTLVASTSNMLSDADHAAIKADLKQALREGLD